MIDDLLNPFISVFYLFDSKCNELFFHDLLIIVNYFIFVCFKRIQIIIKIKRKNIIEYLKDQIKLHSLFNKNFESLIVQFD